jgi:uncharacterized protein YegL
MKNLNIKFSSAVDHLRLAAAQCGKALPFRAWVFIITDAEPQEGC